MIINRLQYSEMQIKQIPIEFVLCWRRIEPRQGDELYELRFLNFVMGLKEITTDVIIEDVINVGVEFETFVHQNSALKTVGPGFNFIKQLFILLSVSLVQLVEYWVVYHFVHLLQVVLRCSLIVSYQPNVNGVSRDFVSILGKKLH